MAAILTMMAIAVLTPVAVAQTEIRRGVLQYNQMQDFALRGSNTVSYGMLIDLRRDRHFQGNIQAIVNAAATILEGYQIVNRGGFFPENAGIPRDQQLTRAEAAYRIFTLENGLELVLYRTPLENTSQYFIRTTTTTF